MENYFGNYINFGTVVMEVCVGSLAINGGLMVFLKKLNS